MKNRMLLAAGLLALAACTSANGVNRGDRKEPRATDIAITYCDE